MDTGLYSSLQRYSSSQWSKRGGLTRLRLVSSQEILSSVMTNIVVDWSTDHAKTPSICLLPQYSPHVRWSGFRNPGNFCLWNPEYWALESRIQLLESRIPLKRGIQNPLAENPFQIVLTAFTRIHATTVHCSSLTWSIGAQI